MSLLDVVKSDLSIIREKSEFPDYSKTDVVESLRECVSINIQNVVDYLRMRQEWKHEDAPCTSPPFPKVWMEYQVTPHVPGYKLTPVAYGILIMAGSGKESTNDVVANLFSANKEGSHFCGVQQQNIYHYQHDRDGQLIPLYDRTSVWDKLKRRLHIDKTQGRMFNQYDAPTWSSIPNIKQRMDTLGVTTEEVDRVLKRKMDLLVAHMAFSFMNCKNVRLETLREERMPDTASFYRPRKPVPTEPLVKTYTITIDPVKKLIASHNKNVEELTPRSLHICRGHFKDFSHGRGLFGKHKGTFWWPMQTRGNTAYGQIKKDYRIGKVK